MVVSPNLSPTPRPTPPLRNMKRNTMKKCTHITHIMLKGKLLNKNTILFKMSQARNNIMKSIIDICSQLTLKRYRLSITISITTTKCQLPQLFKKM